MKTLRLSPSSLNIFLECPRCFWLSINKRIKRPRGIFPSLPGGMDMVIKKYFDGYRLKKQLPPEIEGRLEGKLIEDLTKLEKWRNWRLTDLYYKDKSLNVSLTGALDDCLVCDGYYIPIDYKTRGYDLKEDPRKYYQNQLDCYCLMLESSGYKTKGISYLIFYYPESVAEKGMVKFNVSLVKIETYIESARTNITKAVKLLSGDMPEPNPNCEYCNLIRNRHPIEFNRRGNTSGKQGELF